MGYTTTKRGKRVLHFEEKDADAVLAAYRASRPLGSETPAGLASHAMRASETATRGAHNPENGVQFPGPLPTTSLGGEDAPANGVTTSLGDGYASPSPVRSHRTARAVSKK